MRHLTEEELIEHFYSKGEASDPARQHLEGCAACSEGFAALRSDMAEVGYLEPPARDASYGEQVWQSLAPSLAAYPARKRAWSRVNLWRGLSYAAACAVLVICAFFAGRLWEHKQAQNAAGVGSQHTPQQTVTPQKRVVVVVLSDHLERSERLLVELKHADADNAEMVSPLRDEARSLLAANRVCQQDANRTDDPALATALDHLDQLLAELANQPEGLNTATITRLQSELQSDSLLFEVRVLRARIPDRQAAGESHSNGGTI